MAQEKYIYRFTEVDHDSIPQVGGKGANLGEMTKSKLPVPPGFIVSASAYFYFMKKNKLDKLIAKELKDLDQEDTKRLKSLSKIIKEKVLKAPIPPDLEKNIIDAYHELSEEAMRPDGALVAVRSSATAEDLPEASFAGQQATYLNIQGDAEVVDATKRCFASLFEARSIYYRQVNGFDHSKVALAVPVQMMVQSDVSGIMFTADPMANDETVVVIEAGLGLGEAIVSGSVTPDEYHVDKKSLKIVKKEIHEQLWKIAKVQGENKHIKLSKEEGSTQKLSDDLIIETAKIGIVLDKHYNFPQDCEFAVENGRVFIVQTRPITTLGKTTAAIAGGAKVEDGTTLSNEQTGAEQATTNAKEVAEGKAEILLNGIGASIGMAAGPVKIIHSPDEIDKINAGEVLVTEMTTPDFVPAMKKAVAIVTDTGGKTSHAAIVSRELGIPCVVGSGTATSVLKDGMMISVDGHDGTVFKGKIEGSHGGQKKAMAMKNGQAPNELTGSAAYHTVVPATGTKVYVNLGEPDIAEETALLPADGVGLMRAEFIITGIGEHPMAMIKEGRSKEYVEKLADGIYKMANAFAPRPVIYRATDFKTNEYAHLKGGENFEKEEANPMIGFRGASRYIRQPEEFALELEAIKYVRDKKGLNNVWLMIPFVRTIDELNAIKVLIEKSELKRGDDFKLWIMAEVPAVAILMDEFCKMGIDGVSIGSNDLTQLTLGVDRDNSTLAADFDERDPAVLASIEHIARTCREHNVTCSICGQAASDYAEVVETLVRAGATSVSVSPDRVVATRKLIASIEKRLLVEHAMDEEGRHLAEARAELDEFI